MKMGRACYAKLAVIADPATAARSSETPARPGRGSRRECRHAARAPAPAVYRSCVEEGGRLVACC